MRRNAERDKRTLRELRRDGWRVLVLWECRLRMAKEEQLRTKIIAFLESRRKK